MVGVSVCALAPIFYQRGEYFLVKRVPLCLYFGSEQQPALGSTILKQSCGGQESMEEEKSFTEQSSQRKWYLI